MQATRNSRVVPAAAAAAVLYGLLIPMSTAGAGEQAPDVVSNVPAEEKKEDVWGVGAHPIVGYGPESSLVLGVGALFFVNSRPKSTDQRMDEYGLNVTYSLRNQGSVSLDATKYLRGNDLFLDGSFELTNSPSSFYGIGPRTPDSAEEEYQQRGAALTLAFQTMLYPGLYIGPQYDLFYSRVTPVELDSMLATQQIPGSGTAHESGIGIVATYETTGRNLYKEEGTRVEVRSTVYHSVFASSHTFGKTELGVRRYFLLSKGLVLALHAAFRTTYGDVPFFYLPSLGGNRLLRGYSSERYRANHFIGAQAELRYPLFWRLGGVALLGAADVEQKMSDFGSTVRASGGLGLRFALNRSQTINLRFDMAYNSDGEFTKYLKLREAF